MPIKASGDKTAARLKPGAVIKSKPKGKSKASRVPPLWASSLGTVIDHLSDRHTHEFVKTICCDSKLRALFTDELLRRAKHGPELGDSDVVEVQLLTVAYFEGHAQFGNRPPEANSQLKYWKVGDLPYRFQAALKQQFIKRCSKGAEESLDRSIGNVRTDGRLEFELNNNHDGSLVALEDAYIEHVKDIVFQECVPSREDVNIPRDADEVDPDDVGCQYLTNTCHWDAWDLQLNGCEERMREEFYEEIEEIFDDRTNYGDPLPGHFVTAPGKASLEAVWIRKPRVRLVLGLGETHWRSTG